MYKAITLVVAFAATLAFTEARDRSFVGDHVNHNFLKAQASVQSIRDQYNLKSGKPLLTQDAADTPALDIWSCARGFAKGLQFSSAQHGPCYISLDESINAADNISELLLKAYEPWVWSDILKISQDYVTYLASISTNCDIQKLLNTLTTDPTVLIPQIISRVGGGFIAEIPSYYLKMKEATTCEDFTLYFGKIFALVFDYYIQ